MWVPSERIVTQAGRNTPVRHVDLFVSGNKPSNNERPRSKLRGIESLSCEHADSRHPRMLLSGVQIRIRLDSRLKHAGMTDFGWAIYLTQQAAGNEPLAIQYPRGHVAPGSRATAKVTRVVPIRARLGYGSAVHKTVSQATEQLGWMKSKKISARLILLAFF